MEAFLGVSVIGGIIGLVILIVVLAIRAENKRREAMAAVAQGLGLEFLAQDTGEMLASHAHFNLFQNGHGKRVKNCMRGEFGGVNAALFEYQYTTGHGKNRTTWLQTVASIQSESLSLPEFTLSPEGIFAKIGQVFGYQDIDFDTHPVFSKKFLLRGPEEELIRQLFQPNLLQFFEQRLGASTQAVGDQYIYFFASKRRKPEEVKDLLTDALALLKELSA